MPVRPLSAPAFGPGRDRLGASVAVLARSSAALVLAARLVGAALAYAAQVAAARWLGQDGFGHYALALVWLTLLGHLSTVGTPQAICRHVAADLATGDIPAVRGFIRFGLALVAGAGLVVGMAAALVLWAAPGLVEGAAWRPLVLAVLAAPLLATQDHLESVARALDRPAAGIAPAYCLRHGAALVAFLVLLALDGPADPAVGVAVALGALGIGIVGQVLALRGLVRRRVGPGAARLEIRRWIRTALPVAFVDGTEILLANADVLLVGLFLPAPAVAAYYAATRLVQLLDLARYAASAATAQRFAALFATGRSADLPRLAGLATLAVTLLVGLGATGLVLLAEPLLRLFGTGFAAAAPAVPILAGGLLLSAALGPGEDVLTMTGHERAGAAAYAAALPCHLALSVLLIPTFGLAGAAWASAGALVVRSALLSALVWVRLGIVLPFGIGSVPRARR